MDHLKISQERLNQNLALLDQKDYSRQYQILGARKESQSYLFDFFNRQIAFEKSEFKSLNEDEITLAVKIALSTYMAIGITGGANSSQEDQLVTIRELSDGGPLMSSFTANIAKTIEKTFQGRLARLKVRCEELEGQPENNPGFDLSYRFNAFARVPIVLNFNDIDDMMPAQAGLLYQKNATSFLDSTCLGIIITYLTSQLIQGHQ